MNKTALPFENLLADLQRHGFAIGLDHHLRLQAMLAALDGRCMPSDLKSLLCPILAASEQQQQLFSSLFDHHFSIFLLAKPAAVLEPPEVVRADRSAESPGASDRRRRILLPVAIAVVAIVAGLLFWRGRAPSDRAQSPPAKPLNNGVPEPAPAPPSPNQTPGSSAVPSRPSPQSPKNPLATVILPSLIVVIPAGLFLIGEITRWRRRRLVLHREEGHMPPRSWPMRLQGTAVPLYGSPAFYTAARRLHMRQTGGALDLDVHGTIDATIRSGGFAAFQYVRRTHLPDYLVLIDRTSFRDHQAHLFDSLATALHEEGLFLERFFYEGDPRECWTESSSHPLSLVELQRRYPEHRLLLFGDGAALLNPMSSELASWTAVFSGWKERAVLSPVAMTEWGVRERRIAGQFLVLPATQEGLQALGDYFRSEQSADVGRPGRGGRPAATETPDELREHLGADAFAWLCACAVYPELHWDLTLHITSLASLPPGLPTEENLLKLFRLPWFRNGSIPDDLRYLLIRELTPGQEREVRSAVIEMLIHTPAPEGTIAAERQQMEIVVQRYVLARQEGASARRLNRILDAVPENLRRHYVELRATELKDPSPVDFLLPRAVRKILFVDGHSLLGIRRMTRLAATAAVILLGLYSLRLRESYVANGELREAAKSGKTDAITKPSPPVPSETPAVGEKGADLSAAAPQPKALDTSAADRPVEDRSAGIATGRLLVRAGVQDATVYIDNAPRGRTGTGGDFELDLQAAGHQVGVEKTGYETPSQQTVAVAASASNSVTFALTPLATKLELRGAPAGVEIRAGGLVVGRTDGSALYSSAVPPGDQTLQVILGAATRQIAQRFEPGQTVLMEWSNIAPENPAPLARGNPAPKAVPPVVDIPVARVDPEAEEWNRIRSLQDPRAFQDFLQRFPGSSHATEARKTLDDIAWRGVNSNDRRSLQAYIASQPGGSHRGEAQAALAKLQQVEDTAQILDAITQYVAGFNGQNLAAILKVYPGVPQKTVTGAFDRDIEMRSTPGKPEIAGDSATVVCQQSVLDRRTRQRRAPDQRFTYTLRRVAGGWIIVELKGG